VAAAAAAEVLSPLAALTLHGVAQPFWRSSSSWFAHAPAVAAGGAVAAAAPGGAARQSRLCGGAAQRSPFVPASARCALAEGAAREDLGRKAELGGGGARAEVRTGRRSRGASRRRASRRWRVAPPSMLALPPGLPPPGGGPLPPPPLRAPPTGAADGLGAEAEEAAALRRRCGRRYGRAVRRRLGRNGAATSCWRRRRRGQGMTRRFLAAKQSEACILVCVLRRPAARAAEPLRPRAPSEPGAQG